MGLQVTPISLSEANAFVSENHRHHKPVPGAKFALAVSDELGHVRGARDSRPPAQFLGNENAHGRGS